MIDDDDDGDDDDETTIRNSLYRRLGYNERCQAVNQFRYIALILSSATKRRSATQATNSRQFIILFAKLSTDKTAHTRQWWAMLWRSRKQIPVLYLPSTFGLKVPNIMYSDRKHLKSSLLTAPPSFYIYYSPENSCEFPHKG